MPRYQGRYTSAQNDTVLVSVPSGQGFRVTQYSMEVDASITQPWVTFDLEFDDTTDVRFGGHQGLRPGSGWGEAASPHNNGGLVEGADGQDVIVTCTAPDGGSVVVTVNGEFFPTV